MPKSALIRLRFYEPVSGSSTQIANVLEFLDFQLTDVGG
jgi:hypothetical protein